MLDNSLQRAESETEEVKLGEIPVSIEVGGGKQRSPGQDEDDTLESTPTPQMQSTVESRAEAKMENMLDNIDSVDLQ